MKQTQIFLFFTSLFLFLPVSLTAQEEQVEDTLEVREKEKYGLRVGIDLSKIARSFLEEDYQGFQILGDYRIYEDYYLAAEIGNEQDVISEDNITAAAKGSYAKLGINYNAYNNWAGMQNLIFAGIRYGFSTFSTELREYSIYNSNAYFEPDVRHDPQEFSNLTASWIEFQLGVKVEVLNNLYLGAHVELKRLITETKPNTFDNLYIPGFNRTYDYGSSGVGFGYSISYLIPIYKQ